MKKLFSSWIFVFSLILIYLYNCVQCLGVIGMIKYNESSPQKLGIHGNDVTPTSNFTKTKYHDESEESFTQDHINYQTSTDTIHFSEENDDVPISSYITTTTTTTKLPSTKKTLEIPNCLDCTETYGESYCKLPLTHDLDNSPDDPCCLELCIRKGSFRSANITTTKGTNDWKYYTVLDIKSIDGKMISVCLCLQSFEIFKKLQHTNNNSHGQLTSIEIIQEKSKEGTAGEEKFQEEENNNTKEEEDDDDDTKYLNLLEFESKKNNQGLNESKSSSRILAAGGSQCQIKCKSIDKFNTIWEECSGVHRVKPCPKNGSGFSRWHCLKNGTFENINPNFQNCKSKWLSELENGINLVSANKKMIGTTNFQSPKLTYTNADNILEITLRQLNDPMNTNVVKSSYFQHEFDTIVTLIGKVSQTNNNETDLNKLEMLTTKMVTVYDSVLTQSETLDIFEGSRRATKVLTTLEENVFSLSKISLQIRSMQMKVDDENNTYGKIFTNSCFKITTGVLEKNSKNKKFKFFGWNNLENTISDTSSLTLPNDWEKQIPGNNILYVGIKIDDDKVKKLFPKKLKNRVTVIKPNSIDEENIGVINGPIISLSVSNLEVQGYPIKFKGSGAKIIFQHNTPASIGHLNSRINRKLYPGESPKAISESSICVYWDTVNLVWSKNGCKLIETHSDYTICECQHLTAFAVLMDMHNYVDKDIGLIILTYILCILSSIFLFISIIIFATFRSTKSPRTSITMQLCICLLIGNILVISVMDRNNFNMSTGLCAISAMITHYIFLCAFIWMAIEGYVVYKMLVDVFDSGTDNKYLLYGIAYGLPFLYVLIFAIIHIVSEQEVYGGEMYCWLVGGYIWSFIAPVFIVVMGNILVMVIALRKVYQLNHSTIQVKKKAKSYRTWIFGTLSLTFLLGLTWIFGLLLLINNSIVANVAAYIFSIFNASQGFFIFIFHCWMNENVRNGLQRKFGQHLSTTQSQSRSDRPIIEVKMSTTNTNTTTMSAPTSEEERFQIKRKSPRTKSESSETSQNSRKPAFLRYLGNKKIENKTVDSAFM